MQVTEIPLHLEPVTADPFISSIAPSGHALIDRRQPPSGQRVRQRVGPELPRAGRRPYHGIGHAGC